MRKATRARSLMPLNPILEVRTDQSTLAVCPLICHMCERQMVMDKACLRHAFDFVKLPLLTPVFST